MEINNKEEVRTKLLESLKSAAHLIGLSPYFWEIFTERLLDGKIDGIDPRAHLKSHKSIDLICEDIHKILMPDLDYKEISPEMRMIYLKVVRAVNEGLNY